MNRLNEAQASIETWETEKERRDRLLPVLEQLDAMKKSSFLDLCELLLLLSERVEGSIKWNHPRVLVHIKQRQKVPKQKKAG